jgi:hypothetical protein
VNFEFTKPISKGLWHETWLMNESSAFSVNMNLMAANIA